MRVVRFALTSLIIAGLAGCGAGEKSRMPDVAGKKLDVALSDIKSAGFGDNVDVDGGGVFGIVDKSNWEVCEQTPAKGKPMAKTPRLKVERHCAGSSTEPSQEPSSPPPSPMPPSPSPSPSPSPAPTATASPLTTETSPDLAALLRVGDGCDGEVAPLAAKLAGKTIRYNGSVGALTNHGSYKTRYDIGVLPGEKGPDTATGPNLKFENVGISELHLSGADGIALGDLLVVTARVGAYNPSQCLLLLKPVQTQAR